MPCTMILYESESSSTGASSAEHLASFLSCLAFLGRVDLADLIPLHFKPQSISYKLKTRLGHRHVIFNSIYDSKEGSFTIRSVMFLILLGV